MTDQQKIQRLQEQLKIAKAALKDIVNWNDKLELEWDDLGYRAEDALKLIVEIDLIP